MTVSKISTSSIYKMHSVRNTTWNRIAQSSLDSMKLKELPCIDAAHEVRELVTKLAKVAHVKRVRAIAPRFPNLHYIDFELELPSGTELSDEAWSDVQNLVIDYEWNLRDVSSEKWYFHAQVVYRLSLLEDPTKLIADSDNKQGPEPGIRTWSSPLLNLVVH